VQTCALPIFGPAGRGGRGTEKSRQRGGLVQDRQRVPHPWVQDWYNYLITEKGFSLQTAEAYLHDLRVFFAFCQARGVQPEAVDIFVLREFNRHLQEERDNAHVTRARKISALRSFYRYLLDND